MDWARAESRSGWEASLELLILCSSPIFARGLQHLLVEDLGCGHSHLHWVQDQAGLSRIIDPALVLMAPQCWREFAHWLPLLRDHFPFRPWLIIADVRLTGMFLSQLETRPCLFVNPGTVTDLGKAMHAWHSGCLPGLRTELLAHFARRAPMRANGWTTKFPTATELQCGCAVSLGLRNQEIAAALSVSVATVKSHLHHLIHKLAVANRQELGSFFYQALVASIPETCRNRS